MSYDMTRRQTPYSAVVLAVFAILTFTITWGIIGSYVFWPAAMSARFGEISGSHPFFFLATWAPAIAAFAIVVFWGGPSGLKGFLARIALWRGPVSWWVFILIVIPLVFMVGSWIKGGPLMAPIPPEGVGAVVAVMFMMLLLGPIEELGWRGVAQPLLQRYLAPFWAGALIGIVWGIWHLPAFYLAGVVFAEWSFLPFFIGNITLAILVTPILNATRGSLLLPMMFHWQLNNPFWPDAQPWDTWLLVAVAAVVVWVNRAAMFTREGAVTDVIPGKALP